MGLLTPDGRIYEVAGELAAHNNAKIVQYLAKTGTATGEVTLKDGMKMIAAGDAKLVK